MNRPVRMGNSPAAPAVVNPARVAAGTVARGKCRPIGSAHPGNRANLLLAPGQRMKENTTRRFRAGAIAGECVVSNPGGLSRFQGKPGAMPKTIFASPATVGCIFAVPILWPEIDQYVKSKPVSQSFCAVSSECPAADTRSSSAPGASDAF